MQHPFLDREDTEISEVLRGEEKRQHEGLELIPSENYVSEAVLEAMGSVFTNKYAEGYVGNRYYGGQSYTDAVETLAKERAQKLFGAQFANVQPHAGAPANIATYLALLEMGDTVMGMDLSHGGHLTHGHPVTVATKMFNFVRYKMKNVDTGEIDYEEMRALAKETKPKMILAGFSAYPRELDYEQFVSIAREVGAYAVADISHIAGLVAGGVLKNPFDYGFDVITTTTHKTLRGPRGGMILTRENEEIAKKVDKMVFPGFQGGPLMNMIAAKAVCFGEALHPSFKTYATQVVKNAKAMARVCNDAGLRLITGGTDNHLILADVTPLGLSGKEAQELLDEVGLTVNKNVIPDDTRKPMDPSGIRFGTPAITTRGFTEEDARALAESIVDVLHKREEALPRAKEKVRALASAHPVPHSFVE